MYRYTTEAKELLKFNPQFGAQVVFGGTKFARDLQKMDREKCDILVATPGRIIQHLEEGDAGRRLKGCQMLVLDEADRLLDMVGLVQVESSLPTA